MTRGHRVLWVLACVLLVAGTVGVWLSGDGSSSRGDAASVRLESPITQAQSPDIQAQAAPSPVIARPAPIPAPASHARPAAPTAPKPLTSARRAPTSSRAASGSLVYRGLGSWVDVYDWSHRYTGGRPTVSPEDVDRMADSGVQTLYIQASRFDAPTDVLEQDLLIRYLDRAWARGLSVVAWYLPSLVDPARDLARLLTISKLPVDSLAVDIEARHVADVADRNRRLVRLSADLRRSLPGRTLGAIVLPPVVLEVVNTAYWPDFPYRQLAPSYDVWMIMGYWTNRTGAYRNAYRYTRENVNRLRANLGRAVAVHPIGGIGDETTLEDVEAYKRAAREVGAIGGSLYDWGTTRSDAWPALQPFRR